MIMRKHSILFSVVCLICALSAHGQTIYSCNGEDVLLDKDNVRSAFIRYCRVIVEYFNEDRNEPTFGRGDQIVVDKDVLYFVNQAAEQSCKTSGTPLIKLMSVEAMTINEFPVLYYSYKRKGWEGKQPPVIVNVFRIFNRYESVILTFSYREAERELWKDIHNNILKTFSYVRRY